MIPKKESRKLREAVLTGDSQSVDMASAADNQDVKLSMVASKISVQTTGNLVVAVSVSLTGVDFLAAGSPTNTTPISYNTHNIGVVRLAYTSGSGKAVILAV